jgi:hypothetical protein
MVHKNLEVIILEQVEIYFITIIAYGHHESTLRVKQIDLIIKPADHRLNIIVKKSDVNVDYQTSFDLQVIKNLRLQIKLAWLTLQSF